MNSPVSHASRRVLLIGANDRWRSRIAELLDAAVPGAVLEEEADSLAAAERIAAGEHHAYLIAHDAKPVGGVEVLSRAVAATDDARPPAVAMLAQKLDPSRDDAAAAAGALCTLAYDDIDATSLRMLMACAAREARLGRRLRAALDKLEAGSGPMESALSNINDLLTEELLEVQRDIIDAREVQKSMLPSKLPETPTISWSRLFVPCADVGGDMYNLVRLDERRVMMYLLDVSGHGMPAALFSSALNRIVPALARYSPAAGPAAFVQELSREFPMNEVTGQYFTIQYGILDLEDHVFRCTSAGHPGPLYLPSAGEPELFAIPGPPAGIPELDEFEEISVSLTPGDRLLMFSDGLVEALNKRQEEFGPERMIATLNDGPLADAVLRLQAEVEHWCEPDTPPDDCTAVGFELAAG